MKPNNKDQSKRKTPLLGSYIHLSKFLILSSSIILLCILLIIIAFYFEVVVVGYLFLFLLIPVLLCSILRIPRIYFWSRKPQVEYAIKKFKQQRDLLGLASGFAVMGTLYGVIKKHQIELEYYLQAFTIFDEIQNDEFKATLCQPIASIYEHLKEFPLAQHYYELGLELSQKRNILELISEYHRILGEFYENHGMKEKTEFYYTELDRLAQLKREILDDLELHDPCILCGDKGVEVNLISIPYLLPSYLPKSGCVHLDCLQMEVKNHLPSKASSKVYIMCIIIFFTGYVIEGIWLSWTNSWYYLLIPISIAILIILSIRFRKLFTKSYWVWRWIKKQQAIEKK